LSEFGLLADCRDTLGGRPGQEAQNVLLARFLDVVLEKYDDRYDYPSYTALPLPLLRPTGPEEPAGLRDRTVLLLLADLVRFERLALEGAPPDPDGMLPDARLLGKRLRPAVRVMEPAAQRVLDGAVDPVVRRGRRVPRRRGDSDRLGRRRAVRVAAAVLAAGHHASGGSRSGAGGPQR
jgi:hypothetical protein